MHTFRLWAPYPHSVAVQIRDEQIPLIAGADGCWTVEVAQARPGCDYGFILDGAGPFPDPRSPSQPYGVHGLSRLVDHARFGWTDSGFRPAALSEAVMYELHVGTFTGPGTFMAAIDRLDHLVQLGVTHVELMPVNEFSGAYGWGYDGVEIFAPHHSYGGPEGLRQLVDACHSRGLAVVLDVVYNHFGPSGNYLTQYAPYFTSRYATPWGDAVNFDGPHSDHVRRFFCDNALMWLRDYHCDGLRLDAVHAIMDVSAEPFLEQLAHQLHALGAELHRPWIVIAESDLNNPRLLWTPDRGGYGLDAQWNDDFHHALHTVLTGEQTGYYSDFGTLGDVAKALRNAYVYDGRYSAYRQRQHGRPPTGLDGHQFMAYLQNHDQIGNRARGDRASRLVSVGRLKIGAALVFTAPFVPLIFQGEEWGASTPFPYFTNHTEPDLASAVREGRRREFAAFGWNPDEVPDPQAPETFARAKLNWEERNEWGHAALLQWYQRLIALRRQEPALHDGRMDLVQSVYDESARWFVMDRGPITVAFNLNAQPQHVPIRPGRFEVLLASEPRLAPAEATVALPPDAVIVLRQIR